MIEIDEVSAERIASVIDSASSDFVHLAKIAGLDPATSFKGTNLQGVDFGANDLSAFDFRRSDLRGADLHLVVGLTARQTAGALFDERTIWPDYLSQIIRRRQSNNIRKIKNDPYASERRYWTKWDEKRYWRYHDSGDDRKTLEYCKAIQKLDPSAGPAFWYGAHMLEHHLKEYDAAIKLLEMKIRKDSRESPNAYYFLAQAYESKGSTKEAENSYRKVVSLLGPNHKELPRAILSLAALIVRTASQGDERKLDDLRDLIDQSLNSKRSSQKKFVQRLRTMQKSVDTARKRILGQPFESNIFDFRPPMDVRKNRNWFSNFDRAVGDQSKDE